MGYNHPINWCNTCNVYFHGIWLGWDLQLYKNLKIFFTDVTYKLLMSFTVISCVYTSFVWSKTTFTKYCLTQWISNLPGSFKIHWVRHYLEHDDVIKWKHFPRYWPFVRGIHRLPVNSPHKGQGRGALMFSLICAGVGGAVRFLVVGTIGQGKDHHGVSSGWSSVWHRSNTGLSSTQYEQIPIILGVWPFWLTPFVFRSITFWRAYG